MVKRFKVAPIILIILGGIFLLNNFDILPWSIWTNLWKFWPVLLVLIGIEFLIGQSISLKTTLILLALIFIIPIIFAINPFTKNPFATDKLNISEPLGSLTKAKILIDLPTTNLSIKQTEESTKLIEGQISFSKAAEKPKIEKDESFGQMIFKISQPSASGLPIISSLRNETEIYLTEQIPLEILIKTGASKEKIDLSKLRIDYLEIESQASDLNITFGDLYSSRAKIKTKASNLRIKIPQKLATRIAIDSKVKNLSIGSRFEKKNGDYKTKDFDKAFTRLDIRIESVAGSIEIK
jgi:hypothetical protein